jgi:hypothetical protein
MTRAQAKEIVTKGAAKDPLVANYLVLVLLAIKVAYDSPDLSPDEIESSTYKRCMEHGSK